MQQTLTRRIPGFFYKRNVLSPFAAIFLACVFILSACGGANPSNNTTSNQPKKGGNLVVGLVAEPNTMDPLKSTTLYNADVIANMADPLLKYDLNNKLQPYLASAYKYESPTVLALTLRTDVKFHDGTPFNADAVIFNLQRYIDDKSSPRHSDVTSIDSMVKVDDSHVKIMLKQPFAPLLDRLAGSIGPMFSPTAIQKLGLTGMGNAPVDAGSGPFRFVEWIKGDHITLKANPTYWQKDANGIQLPYLQTITYHTITNTSVMFNNLRTGQIQVATAIDPNDVKLAKADPTLIYRETTSPGFGAIFLNTGAPPLDNVHVRRAIAWGLNRQEIIDHVYQGIGTPAKGPLTPVSWAYDKNIQAYSYDPTKAKDELAQSGLSNVSFTMKISGNDPTTAQLAQFIQSQLQAVGIKVEIKSETFTAIVSELPTHSYQATPLGWTGGVDPDGNTYTLFQSKGGFNFWQYSSPQVDALLDSGRTTVDQAKRVAIYQQAQQMIVQDVPFVFIRYPVVQQNTTKSVKNYALYASAVTDFTSVWLG